MDVMNLREKSSSPKVGETIVRFSVFTGFWAIAYFFMCLTAFAVSRSEWAFAVRVDSLLIWFSVFVTLAIAIGNIIGLTFTLAVKDRIAAAHNRFGGEFQGNLRQTVQFLASIAMTGPIFLGLSNLAASITVHWFQGNLEVMERISWSVALPAIILESVSVTGLVLAIIVYVRAEYERMRES